MTDKKSLEERIAEARQDIEEKEDKYMGVPLDESGDTKRGKRAASEFMGLVIAGIILGIICDRTIGTAPFGLFTFIIAGFVGGVFRANHIINKK